MAQVVFRHLYSVLLLLLLAKRGVDAINGGTPSLQGLNGWKVLEVITEGDVWDGYEMPNDFDGLGAWLVNNDSRLRFLINHETTGDSTISEVNVDLSQLKIILRSMRNGATGAGGVSFVKSARQAFRRFTSDLGNDWSLTSQPGDISFDKFCSGQPFIPNTFGPNQGFVDHLYITGEEEDNPPGRLMVLDSKNRDLYQLSGKVGHAQWVPGNGGMPFDAWENAALIDTGSAHKDRIALLLSSDGGSESLQLYVGLKGMTRNCKPVDAGSNFLERNGLACGRWWFLTGSFPDNVGETLTGSFSGSAENRLSSGKLEDIDTSPSDPTKVALTDESDGLFIFDFDLKFTSRANGTVFDPTKSSFTVRKAADRGCDNCLLEDPDNVEWTNATTLNGTSYPQGILFINEDNDDGAVIQMDPRNASNAKAIAKVTNDGASAGTFDISHFLGYMPASILATSSMGDVGSLSIMINPEAALVPTLQRPTNIPSPHPTPSPAIHPTPRPTGDPTLSPSKAPLAHNNVTNIVIMDIAWLPEGEVSRTLPQPNQPPTSTPEPTLDPTVKPSLDPSTRRALMEDDEDSSGSKEDIKAQTNRKAIIGLMILAGLVAAAVGLWILRLIH